MLVGKRKAPDLLATVMQAKNVSLRPHAFGQDLGSDADMIEHMHRIGADLNAGTNLAEARRLLKDFNRVAGLEETAGRAQAADTAACDQNLWFHGLTQ